MNCKHCGKRIRNVNWYNGPGWTHEDEMVGRWCRITGAEPKETGTDMPLEPWGVMADRAPIAEVGRT